VHTEVLLVGDVMLGRRVYDGRRPVRPLRHLADHIGAADVAVANLECALSDDGPPQQGGDSFACPSGTLRGLERLGFDALSLANNHTGDFGTDALVATVRAFDDSGVIGFGAGEDLAEAGRAAVVEHDGVTFGFLGFNAIGETPRATRSDAGALSVRMPPRTGPLVDADLDHVRRLVRRLADEVDVVVVLPHWGTQYTHTPESIQSEVARALVGAGADLVVGGHPHWVQGLELVRARGRDGVVVHSLGNAVFDMDFMSQTMEGVALSARFEDATLTGFTAVPYRMGADFAPRPLTGRAARQVLGDFCGSSLPPRTLRARPATPAPLGPCGAVVPR
jgi:poly-gamma-glutamate synthesis protein (capsule biosynthesis protein)